VGGVTKLGPKFIKGNNKKLATTIAKTNAHIYKVNFQATIKKCLVDKFSRIFLWWQAKFLKGLD